MSSDQTPDEPISKTADEIQQWMVDYLANELEVAPETIDVSAPFENFALDSAAAIGMTGDLEQWLNQRIDPTVVYDYPTIEEFAEYLANQS